MDHAIELVRKRLSTTNIDIVLNLQPELPLLNISPDHLEQVCLNLIINAAEHMPQGGTLTIKASIQQNMVEISFQDTGEGIEQQELEWIFEPWFTTKISGTGLGLSVSQNIIQQYGGQISVNSSTGQGSIFIISLPITEEI